MIEGKYTMKRMRADAKTQEEGTGNHEDNGKR
jgi:hypothetical protein